MADAAPGIPAAPKLSLAAPPLKKSKSIVLTGNREEQTDQGDSDLEQTIAPPTFLAFPAAAAPAMPPLEQNSWQKAGRDPSQSASCASNG